MADEMQWSGYTNVMDEMATSPTSGLPDADLDHGQLTMESSLTEHSTVLSEKVHDQHNSETGLSGASSSDPLPSIGSRDSYNDDGTSSTDEKSECTPESPLGYARYHGLCHDHCVDYLLDSKLIPLPSQPDSRPDEMSIDDELERFLSNWKVDVGEVHFPLRENLDVDEDTATFLRSVAELGKPSSDNRYFQETGLRKLKLDLPVLSDDHELVMLKISRRNTVRLSSQGVTPFVLDDEADEGPRFPSYRLHDKETLEKEIASEKLDVDEETMEYLRDVHKLLASKTQDVAGEAYRQYKARSSIHVTPPLLPVSPPYSPGMPASEAMQMELTSTPEDLIARDAAAAERQILQEDEKAFTRTQVTRVAAPGSFTLDHSPLGSFLITSASQSPLERKRLRNLKLESPLTPRDNEESPPKKAKKVTFPAELTDLVPQPSTNGSAIDIENAREELDAFVKEIIAPFAESVMHQAMSEELIEIDTVMRVPVPSINAIKTEAPWNQFSSRSKAVSQLQSQRTFLRYTREETLRAEQRWSGVSKLEKLLLWKPFSPYLGKVDLNEQFDDGSLARYLSSLAFEDEVDIHALICKRDRLRILDSCDSDEGENDEIRPLSAAPSMDESATKEATQKVPEIVDVHEPPAYDGLQTVGIASRPPDMLTLLRRKQQELAGSPGAQTRVSAAGTSVPSVMKRLSSMDLVQGSVLSNFLYLQGTHLGNPKSQSRQLADMTASVAPPAVMVPHISKPREDTMRLPAPRMNTGKEARIPLVVAATFMAHRNMLRGLQSALPNAELVERVTPERPGQHGKSTSQPEADLTLSPSTGLLTTTLQKLKQKPLPGHTNFTGVRDHVIAVSTRYERLIVLVSEASGSSSEDDIGAKPIYDRDCEALADLAAFTAALHKETKVLYIAGGENELLQWIVASVMTYGIVDGSMSLLQEETTWERFLRRAGLNTYAAQAILGRLREPPASSQFPSSSSDPNGSPKTGRYGLIAFVTMCASERIREFGVLLGGEHVLRRVNAVLESSWNNSAAARKGR